MLAEEIDLGDTEVRSADGALLGDELDDVSSDAFFGITASEPVVAVAAQRAPSLVSLEAVAGHVEECESGDVEAARVRVPDGDEHVAHTEAERVRRHVADEVAFIAASSVEVVAGRAWSGPICVDCDRARATVLQKAELSWPGIATLLVPVQRDFGRGQRARKSACTQCVGTRRDRDGKGPRIRTRDTPTSRSRIASLSQGPVPSGNAETMSRFMETVVVVPLPQVGVLARTAPLVW